MGAGARRASVFLALCLAVSSPALADEAPYLRELIERADALDLAREPGWLALVHYRAQPLRRGVTSQADDPDFFLAEGGRRDPRAELVATLRAFFAPPVADAEAQHPQCVFVARYHWLDERLGFDPERLPERSCPRFEEWRVAMRPTGITLVFPEAFMNNPASMFGHTLLRVDTTDDPRSRDLLGWAINFAGATGDEGGPIYAFKGIFGLYRGYFSIAPYYEKVKEYGDWENRDIWEYRLDFTPDEMERLLMHLWELQGIAFDYYYFDENCSQQLLALLEAARPELRTSDFVPLWVIPSDTVRTIVSDTGLLAGVAFRPAAATELRHHARQLPRDHRRLARLIALGTVDPADDLVGRLGGEERAAVLSVAHDHLRYSFLAGKVSRQESLQRSRRILVARSRVDVRGSTFAPVPSPPTRPDEGHASARFALGGGWRDGRSFVEARIRPAFHDLVDPEGGYTRGAQIQFLDVAVRYFPADHRVRLHEAVLLDMVSLAPWDRFFRSVSFRFDTGLRTRLLPEGDGGSRLDPEPVWRTRGGLGLSFDLGGDLLAYGMGEATADVGPDLEDEFALGVGASVGVYLGTARDRWRGHLFGRVARFALGDRSTSIRAGLEQRLTLTRNTALKASTAFERDFGQSWLHAVVSWNVYF